jgi:hypothetical protein
MYSSQTYHKLYHHGNNLNTFMIDTTSADAVSCSSFYSSGMVIFGSYYVILKWKCFSWATLYIGISDSAV